MLFIQEQMHWHFVQNGLVKIDPSQQDLKLVHSELDLLALAIVKMLADQGIELLRGLDVVELRLEEEEGLLKVSIFLEDFPHFFWHYL